MIRKVRDRLQCESETGKTANCNQGGKDFLIKRIFSDRWKIKRILSEKRNIKRILSERWNIQITEPGRNNDSSRAERVQGGEKGRRGQAGWQLASRRSNKRIESRTSKRNVEVMKDCRRNVWGWLRRGTWAGFRGRCSPASGRTRSTIFQGFEDSVIFWVNFQKVAIVDCLGEESGAE